MVSNKLSFDNTKPVINITYNDTTIDEQSLTKEFVITYSDNDIVKEVILDNSSIVVDCTTDSKYTINIVRKLDNGWIVEVTFEKETLKSGYFSLTILSNLVEDQALNRNDAVTTNLIKIK